MKNNRAALDIVLELIEDGTLSAFDAKILIQAINKNTGTQFVPVPYKDYTQPDWTYDPHRPGQPWFTTSTGANDDLTTNDTING